MTVLRNTGPVFVECPSVRICVIFFLRSDWEEGHGGKVPFSSLPVKWTDYHHDLTAINVNLDHLAKVVSFPHSKVTLFPFPYVAMAGSHYVQLMPKEWGLRLYLLETEYLHKLLGILHGRFVHSPLIYDLCSYVHICLFIYSVIYLCQYGLMNIYYKLWFIIWYYFIYFVAHIVLLWPLGEFFQPAPVSLWHIPVIVCCVTLAPPRLVLYISCPSARINHFTKESYPFHWRMVSKLRF